MIIQTASVYPLNVRFPQRRRRLRGLGQVNCSGNASYADQHNAALAAAGVSNCNAGTMTTDQLSQCVNAQAAAVNSFNEQWEACIQAPMGPQETTGYQVLMQQTNDPYLQQYQNQLATTNPNYVVQPVTASTGQTYQVLAPPLVPAKPPVAAPNPPAPPPPQVINPTPPSQPIYTGSSTTSPVSVLSQANGQVTLPTTTVTSTEWISGIPNWAVVVGGAGAALLLVMAASKK